MEHHKVLWRTILSNALPIRSIIHKKFHIDDASCPICGVEEESMEHLFLKCDLAFHLWPSSPWGIFPVLGTGVRMWDWVKFIWNLNSKGVNTDEVFLYASIVVDTIWRVRNDKVHNNNLDNVKRCIDYIHHSFADYRAFLLSTPTSIVVEAWHPPPHDWIKLNCDVKVGLESMSIAIVTRNHEGEVAWVRTAKLDFSDALCEKAECCLALDKAKEKGCMFIIVESDSRVVINSLNGKEIRWEVENYSSFCNSLSPYFVGCVFSCIGRSCNFVA
ncbi:hypothetical protein CsatA_028377 [Cannabis sativa]